MLSRVGDSREEGPGALGTTCFLNKGSFPCSVLPLGSGYEQRDGTGREEVFVGGHLPGLEVTGSQGGSSSLGSPQALHLHLAQPINTLSKVTAPARGAESPVSVSFPPGECQGPSPSSLALHMVKTSGNQRCLVPAAKPSRP